MTFDDFKKKTAKNIKVFREGSGLTQESMTKFGFNARHYQDIESGKINISIETIFRLSKAFKKKPEDFLK